MKNSLKIILNKVSGLFFGLVALGIIYGCVEELPGPGSMPDDTPPAASFSYASQENFLEIKFTNLSVEALSYEWDFGVDVEIPDSVLTAVDPSYTYASVGTYDVTLTAVDGLGVVSDTTIAVVVEEGPYLPVILEAQFEGDGATGDARDPWDAEWSTVIQITSDGALDADGNKTKGGKLPSDGQRVAYQEIVVEAESNYDIAFVYTLTDAVAGKMTVEILDVTANGETFQTYEDTRDHVIGAVTLNDQDDPDTYVGGEVSFASGTSTKVAIMVSNSEGIEARFDNFTVEIGNAGAVPPSANFTVAQSDVNYLEYTFTNASLNAASYSWDFGDESTPSTEESPVYEYAEAGTYTVTLTVKSEGGLTGELSEVIVIHDPVTPEFSYAEGANEFTIEFTDESVNAASVLWDFGDGFKYSTTEEHATVTHVYNGGPGFYTVTLTSISSTGLEVEKSSTLAIGVPKVLGGDFEDTDTGDDRDYWRAASFSGGETSTTPYGGSSDGAFQTYDGTDTDAKTRGAKIDASRCAVDANGNVDTGNTRYAYQEMSLSPGVEYYLEFSYNNADGTIVAGEILDGHFDDGSDALAASLDGSSLIELQGTISNGEISGGSDSPQWRTIRGKFTAPVSGEVSIWMWAFGGKSYYDNIKILPASIVEAP
ncbi:MAG: PKD domain-containing protein [Reichenbachiella sp.]|uniref:PKD domain-containing protein n=3 Tax=Reichenbachiella sp. TaxID=2184521 RepID=UPI00329A3C69